MTTTYQGIKGTKRVTQYLTWDANYGSYSSDYPVTNLKTDVLARVCRTTNAAVTSTKYKATLDKQRLLRLIGLVRHNLSLYSTLRIRLYTSSDATISSINTTTDQFTSASHGITTTTAVTFWNSGGTLPTGLVEGTIYYVRSTGTNRFTLHTTSTDATNNTSKIDVSTSGSGTTYVLRGLTFDSGTFDVWPRVYGDSPEWEDDNWWTGKYTDQEIASYRSPTRPYVLDNVYLAKTITVQINDTSNTNGFVDLGMIEVSRGWQFQVNPDVGAQFGFRFRSRSIESESGTKEFQRRSKPRVFNGTIGLASQDQTYENAFQDQRQLDEDTVFLWFPHPLQEKHWLRNSFLARNVSPGLLGYTTQNDGYSIPISIQEVL